MDINKEYLEQEGLDGETINRVVKGSQKAGAKANAKKKEHKNSVDELLIRFGRK